MGSLVYRALLVLLVHQVNQDSLESRVTLVSSVFQEHREKSKTRKTPTFSPACSLTLLQPLRVLRVNQERRVHLGRLGWQGFQVPWDQLDRQDPLGHQGHRTVLDLVTRMDLR